MSLRRQVIHDIALERARKEFPQARIDAQQMRFERRWNSWWRRYAGTVDSQSLARIRKAVDEL